MTKLVCLITIISLFSLSVKSQSIEHIQKVFHQYEKSLDSLQTLLKAINNPSDSTKIVDLAHHMQQMQQQKFSLDSAFVEFKYLSNKAHLKSILNNKKLNKKKNRQQLEYDLLEWSISTCHPQSELLWHRVSKFFYSLEMASLNNLGKNTLNQQLFITWIQKDLPKLILEQKEIATLILGDLQK